MFKYLNTNTLFKKIGYAFIGIIGTFSVVTIIVASVWMIGYIINLISSFFAINPTILAGINEPTNLNIGVGLVFSLIAFSTLVTVFSLLMANIGLIIVKFIKENIFMAFK